MKPREFDELVKQKFDQGDFEYNPANWEALADELDGNAKKRRYFLGWLPLVGIAASMAFAVGVSTVMHQAGTVGTETGKEIASNTRSITTPVIRIKTYKPETTTTPANDSSAGKNTQYAASSVAAPNSDHSFSTTHKTITDHNDKVDGDDREDEADLAGKATVQQADSTAVAKKKKKPIQVDDAIFTFKSDRSRHDEPKTAILISGGFNVGNQANGYSVGASARRMINDKVYVEGSVAFTGSSNMQRYKYMDYSTPNNGSSLNGFNGSGFAAKVTLDAKATADDVANDGAGGSNKGTLKTIDRQYNLYYAQVTPTIGYKILKKVSVGLGPDFQKVLVDNRPEQSSVDRGNLQEAPLFDIGLMGKTEVSVSRNVKAAVYYREGINNVITPTNRYIERSYFQFQIRCAILNK